MDHAIFGHALLDQFEGRTNGSGTELRWDGQAWIGTDYDKLWLRSEGVRRSDGSIDDGQHELLYDRAISTYFDLQAGIRSDLDSKPARHWGAFGVEALRRSSSMSRRRPTSATRDTWRAGSRVPMIC